MLVERLDAIILTANDLPTMNEGIDTPSRRTGGLANQPSIVDGFIQFWDGTQPEEHITVSYWLFSSVADAQRAAEEWKDFLSSEGTYQPEPTADVIGDATWRLPTNASIWFVKSNVLVDIMAGRPKVDQLPLTRSVARKIAAKINAALPQE